MKSSVTILICFYLQLLLILTVFVVFWIHYSKEKSKLKSKNLQENFVLAKQNTEPQNPSLRSSLLDEDIPDLDENKHSKSKEFKKFGKIHDKITKNRISQEANRSSQGSNHYNKLISQQSHDDNPGSVRLFSG